MNALHRIAAVEARVDLEVAVSNGPRTQMMHKTPGLVCLVPDVFG